MALNRMLLRGLVAVLALGMAACTLQEPDVTPEEQVGAEQRADMTEDSEGGEGGDGEDGGEGGGGDTYTFVAVDIEFEEAPTEVAAGSVTFELVNDGSADHNVVVKEVGDEAVVEAAGGETATGTVDLEPGEYTYECSIPGHAGSMNGSFTVS